MPELLPLKVDNVSYQTPKKKLLDAISFDIKQRGISVIMGPNGAGKSLLIRLMHGLIAPTSGQIDWNGLRFDQAKDCKHLRAQQSMVFQQPILLRRSVRANLKFTLPGAHHTIIDRALSNADLHQLADQPARQLSGGEQQRLAVARAMITQPSVIFFDETTANLDPNNMLLVEQQIRQAKQQGIKVIMITHDIAQAKRLADDVLFLHQGQLIGHYSAGAAFAKANREIDPRVTQYLQGQILV